MKFKCVKNIRLPGWLFLIGLSVYVESLLYVWTGEDFVFGRFATILVFAAAFGAAMGLIASFFPPKGEKWVSVTLGFLLTVLCLVEYFIHDAFSVFMPLISVFATAEGVATGYTETVISLLLRNLWRIGLVLLPVVLYGVFAAGTCRKWKKSAALALAAAALYGGGFAMIHLVNLDTIHLSAAANYDGTVRSFGLSMGTILDLSGGMAAGQGGTEFEIIQVETLPAETESAVTEAPATEPEETAAPTEPPRVYLPHSYDLDFAALAEAEKNTGIANLHRYLASLTPAVENDYTGLFAGKNLILITAEAFSAKVVDPERTPTLYRMATEGIHFTDYYHQLWGCGTTGGEFANLLGLVPYGGTTTMMEVVQQDMFLTMGKQLQKQGYVSCSFHNNDHTYYNRHKTHTALGYDKFFAWGNGMEGKIANGWTRSDAEMVELTLPEYLEQDQPFSLYYMTVSAHSPYTKDNYMARKHYDLVKDLPYDEFVKCYLASNMELEFAMQSMIAMLEEAGIADDTVIVISTDHYPYGLAPSDTWGGGDHMLNLYGPGWSEEQNRDQSALIIWSGCLEDMDLVVDEPVSALDILPTLSNLFGLEYDSRLLIGRDVFSEEMPLVFWPLTYSWKTDRGYYDAKTGSFTPAEGAPEVTEEYIQAVNAMVKNKTVYSRSVQNQDYFDVISKLLNQEEPAE